MKKENPESAYHFKYNDPILLCHSLGQKYLHISVEYESQIAKKMEISLSELSWKTNLEEWVVESAEDTVDDYWRVG